MTRLFVRFPLLLVSGVLSACVLTSLQEERPVLEPGIRVELEGHLGDSKAREVDQKELEKALEVTGPIELDDAGRPQLLGVPVEITDSTDWEAEDKEPIDPFELTDGQWVKIKAELRADGSLKFRKVRRQEERKGWEVEGIITGINTDPQNPEAKWLELGPYSFRIEKGTDVTLFDPQAEWDDFLKQSPLGRRVTKEQKFVPYTIPLGDRARLGGQFGFGYEREDNFDLNDDRNRDEDKFDLGAKLSTVFRIGEESLFLAEVTARQEWDLKENRPNEDDSAIEPGEVYFFVPNVVIEGLHFQFGRQDLDETREWLYDQVVDGVRAYYEQSRVSFEVLASTLPQFMNRDAPEPATILLGVVSARPLEGNEWTVSAYVVDRRSRDLDDFSPFHYGLRSYVKPDPGWSHWLELSRADGLVMDRRLRGYAFDGGVTFVADHELEPSVTVGYALGSGSDRAGDTDRTFRQTGLQDNNGKFNGVTSFRYYGEVMDPELSNLQVYTVGVGIRPTRQSSVDLIFHGYRQDTATVAGLRSDLRSPTNGRRQHLGKALDLVMGYRSRRMTCEIIGGAFFPGAAFDNDDLALLGAFQIRFKF